MSVQICGIVRANPPVVGEYRLQTLCIRSVNWFAGTLDAMQLCLILQAQDMKAAAAVMQVPQKSQRTPP